NEAIELCEKCYRSLPFNNIYCVRCALPLADEDNKNTLCGRCIQKLPEYDYAHSVFRYEEDVIGLIHQLKFRDKITYARSFGELLLTAIAPDDDIRSARPDCLLPVPLHPSRLRQRGFNQSIEIARVISKKYAIPIECNAVIRQRRTVSQTGLNAQQRQKNIRGAFAMVKPLQGKHALIIDDVITTGSTVNELSRLLKKNNVERVGVLSIARAPIK
ncbi:MAG: phosphoribosyltransferase, partial [Gammaproteobacteria bacterium]